MDLHAVLRDALPSLAGATNNLAGMAGNGTEAPLPAGLSLESLMPYLGINLSPLLRIFMIVNQAIGSPLGLDPAVILTIFGVLWAGSKVYSQMYNSLKILVQDYMMVSIHISSADEIYGHLMKWLANQPRMANSRCLTAETVTKTAWEDDDFDNSVPVRLSTDGSGKLYLNFSSQNKNTPPRFVPAMGSHGFWFEGRYFTLFRKQEAALNERGGSSLLGGQPLLRDKESMILSTFGWSPEPVKKLLQHAREQYYGEHYARTVIKRPNTANARRFGPRHAWSQVADRPVRPMKTVVLDQKQKQQVLDDINEFLHPATPRWYANRGIPLRRGYLFHGPPGTGKTSLSFALAGVFGLGIYVISLMEPTLTEEDLLALFNSLPRRCVVLLEDIDTAGLGRQGDGGGGEAAKPAVAIAGVDAEKTKMGSISLSGLLNAIDGVASHEGRVLIMTTNKPESLDDALIRPGRVDLQVAFTNATQAQAVELFQRMYEADGDDQDTGFPSLSQSLVPPAAAAAAAAAATITASGEEAATVTASGGTVVEKMETTMMTTTTTSNDDDDDDEKAPLLPELVADTDEKKSVGPPNGSATASSSSQAGQKQPEESQVEEGVQKDPEGIEEKEEGAVTIAIAIAATAAAASTAAAAAAAAAADYAPKFTLPGAFPPRTRTPTPPPIATLPVLLPAAPLPPHKEGSNEKTENDETAGTEAAGTETLHPEELLRMAAEFGAKIPEDLFSPAEIQGFLLKRKKEPRRALGEVDVWVEAMVEQKASKSKVLQVQ